MKDENVLTMSIKLNQTQNMGIDYHGKYSKRVSLQPFDHTGYIKRRVEHGIFISKKVTTMLYSKSVKHSQ